MTEAHCATTLTLATAANAEKSLSPWEAVRIYKKAFSWCMFVSLGALLWGYDAQISGGLLSVPSFRNDFGYTLLNQQLQDGGGSGGPPDFVIPAKWQSAFNSVSSIGGMFGGLGMGFLADTFGRRATIAAACLISITGVILQFFCPAHNNAMLLVGKLVNGFSLGMFVSSASGYCAELSPLPLRGITTGAVNLWIVVGQFLSNCVIDGTGTRDDKYAYRIPFALQWIFPVILLAGIAFAPESPWYLVKRGRIDAARQILHRLSTSHRDKNHPQSPGNDDKHIMDIELQLRQIQETITLEDSYAAQSTYLDCFKGVNRRRTLIALMAFVLQQAVGVVFILGFSTYFFQLAGFDDHNSFRLGVGVTAIGIVGNLTALYMVNALGRRTLFGAGMLGCTLLNLAVGIASIPNTSTSRWAMAVMTIIYNFVYQASIGPLGYVIFAEVGSAKLRSKTVGIGICVNSLCSLVMNTIIPYLVNPDEANLGGKVGFIFGGLGLLGTIWTWFCIPETKSRTVDELDELFEMRIGARKFALTNPSRTRPGSGTDMIMHELGRGGEPENYQRHLDGKTV